MPVKLSEVLMSDPSDFEVDMLTRSLDRLITHCDGLDWAPGREGADILLDIKEALQVIKDQGDVEFGDIPDGDDVGPL